LKILITTFEFPPRVGGVGEVARAQVHGLAARGHEVVVATGFDPNRTAAHSPPDLIVRQFKVDGFFLPGGHYGGEAAAYQDFIAREPADIILCHCWENWATDLAVPALKDHGAKKIILSHGLDAHTWHRQKRFPWGLCAWARKQPYVWRLPKMMRAFDRLVFLSPRQDAGRFFDHWLAARLLPERISIIPNGVHRETLRNARSDFRQVFGITAKHLLLNVANYCDRKNQLATLRDFIQAGRPDATLVFIGSEFNDYSREMERNIRKNQARSPQSSVLMLEKIPRELINAAYRAADVFLLSAKQETQPLSILDAMAAGIPFISTNTGCVAEFSGGWCVPAGKRTIQAIHRLLDDPELRRQLGRQGQLDCETKYNWPRVLNDYETLFRQLLNQ
jgi:glycosyltransferase involved in cell wall biosynthesis